MRDNSKVVWGSALSCDFLLRLLVTFAVLWIYIVRCDFYFRLVVTFFVPFSQNSRLPNFFRPQTANAVKYSICTPLEASSLAFDEARGSSATHLSQSCSPQ